MGLFIRTCLIWLLAVAIPAQGAAAATMAFCGPDHHGGASTVAPVSPDAPDHAHHGDGAHAHEADAGASPEALTADDASVLVKAGHAAKQKCSACASCCSLGAILSTVPVMPVADLAPTVFAAVVPTVDAFAADGPDRPPRNILA